MTFGTTSLLFRDIDMLEIEMLSVRIEVNKRIEKRKKKLQCMSECWDAKDLRLKAL